MSKMKALKYILLAILPLFALYSCEDDDGSNPFIEDDELRIHMAWQEHLPQAVGDTVIIDPKVSPADGATYKWTLDGEVISTGEVLNFEIKERMVSELKLEVSRNNFTMSRTAMILVPNDFVPKAYNKKSIGFLTGGGSVKDVDWDNITHLVVSSAVIDEKGDIDMKNLENLSFQTITSYARHNGVYVLLEVSGVLSSYMNAAPVYASYTFYDQAVGSKYKELADKIVNKVKELGVQGVNIYMDKANTSTGGFDNPSALKEFYSYLGDKLKESKYTMDGSEYDYIASLSVVGGWTRGSLASCVNIPTYDWVNVLAFAAEDLAPTPHSAQWYAEQEVGVWLGWQGPIVPSRLVLVAPAFGLRYFGTPKDYNWGNLWQFTEYMPYKTICEKHSGAADKNTIVIVENGGDNTKAVDKIFYDGVSEIKSKAAYALSKDIAGMGLWSLENDSKKTNESLLKIMNNSLGN